MKGKVEALCSEVQEEEWEIRGNSPAETVKFISPDSCPNPSVQPSLKETMILQRARREGQSLISSKALGASGEFWMRKRGKAGGLWGKQDGSGLACGKTPFSR